MRPTRLIPVINISNWSQSCHVTLLLRLWDPGPRHIFATDEVRLGI